MKKPIRKIQKTPKGDSTITEKQARDAARAVSKKRAPSYANARYSHTTTTFGTDARWGTVLVDQYYLTIVDANEERKQTWREKTWKCVSSIIAHLKRIFVC